MKKIWTYDEANLVIKNADNLSEDELLSLVEFLVGKGIEVKINSNGVSCSWSKATKDIYTLIKHLVVKIVEGNQTL